MVRRAKYTVIRIEYHYETHWHQADSSRNNNYCKADPGETKAKAEEAADVPVPDYDPIVRCSIVV